VRFSPSSPDRWRDCSKETIAPVGMNINGIETSVICLVKADDTAILVEEAVRMLAEAVEASPT